MKGVGYTPDMVNLKMLNSCKYVSLSRQEVDIVGSALCNYSSYLRSKLSDLHDVRRSFEEVGCEDWMIDSLCNEIARLEDSLHSLTLLRDRLSRWSCEVSHE